MKRFMALVCAWLCVAGGMALADGTETVVVQDVEYSTTMTLWAREEAQARADPMLLSAEEGQAVSLVWLPLPAGIQPAQLAEATLSLRPQEESLPFEAGYAEESWLLALSAWDEMRDALAFEEASLSARDAEGWQSADVTETVRAWLSGQMDNNGFAIRAAGGALAVWRAGDSDTPQDAPRLTVRYHPQTDAVPSAPYNFSLQKEGNCLSYALRDTDPIYLDALAADPDEMQRVYDAQGEAEAFAYFTERVFDYINANSEALAIAGLRRLDGFDAQIDPAREYRVALRVGFREANGVEGIQIADGEFDYHLRAQVADGSWAEKFPLDISRLSPGSNAALDPGLYPWDSSYMWGYAKWEDYYTSETVYFAVEKEGEAFTAHLSQAK